MNGEKIAVLFPGQGSQYIGMGKDFLARDRDAALLMDMAEAVSGFPLRRLCLEGPMAELTRTLYLQPALTAIDLICWQAVRKAGLEPDFFVGHSLGEYSALCAAGVLSPEDTLKLVTERGRLMEREAGKHPGGMRAVLGLTLDRVREIIAGLNGPGVVTTANHNSEKQIVISGQAGALEAVAAAVAEQGGKSLPLKVSGAWHSPLVQGAVPDFEAAMATVAFAPPRTPLLLNVTARREEDPAAIRAIMARQIASTVRWLEIVEALMAREVRIFVEVGPKAVLSGLLKKIVPRDYSHRCLQVDSPAGLAGLGEALQG